MKIKKLKQRTDAQPGDLYNIAGNIYLLVKVADDKYLLSALEASCEKRWGEQQTLSDINSTLNTENATLCLTPVTIIPMPYENY